MFFYRQTQFFFLVFSFRCGVVWFGPFAFLCRYNLKQIQHISLCIVRIQSSSGQNSGSPPTLTNALSVVGYNSQRQSTVEICFAHLNSFTRGRITRYPCRSSYTLPYSKVTMITHHWNPDHSATEPMRRTGYKVTMKMI